MKGLHINDLSERNESKNKMLRKIPLCNFKMMATMNSNLENSNSFCFDLVLFFLGQASTDQEVVSSRHL